MITPEPVSNLDKRRKYDDVFKAEALRLAQESRSTRAVARQLGISEKLLYRWQAQQSAAELGSDELARDPEVLALRAELQRVPTRVKQSLAVPEAANMCWVTRLYERRVDRWPSVPHAQRTRRLSPRAAGRGN